jgi:hypothetical protein
MNSGISSSSPFPSPISPLRNAAPPLKARPADLDRSIRAATDAQYHPRVSRSHHTNTTPPLGLALHLPSASPRTGSPTLAHCAASEGWKGSLAVLLLAEQGGMEPDDLLCSRNARSRKTLVERAQWKINQAPSLRDDEQALREHLYRSTRAIEDRPGYP